MIEELKQHTEGHFPHKSKVVRCQFTDFLGDLKKGNVEEWEDVTKLQLSELDTRITNLE